MTELRKKLADLRQQWELEKSGLGDVQQIRQQLDEAELQYNQLGGRDQGKAVGRACRSPRPITRSSTNWTCSGSSSPQQLESSRQERSRRRSAAGGCLRREVGPEEIAEVVSAWTGIPVTRMMETERAKLLVLEDRIHQRLVDQDEAVEAVANAVRRNRSGLQDPNRPDRLVHLPRADRRGQDRAVQGPGRGDVRRRERHDPARHERVHGAAHRQPADRRPAGLRGLRRRRHADRGRPPPALLR